MVNQPAQAELKKRFAELPAPVQRAITSVDVQKQLREAADRHKLHLDQWEILENEVLMTLFGITPIEELQKSIQNEVKVPAEVAAELATDISRIVFDPIRHELERQLEHPEAKAKEMSGVEQAREQALQGTRDEGRGTESEATGTGQQAGVEAPGTRYQAIEEAQVTPKPSSSPIQPGTPPNPPPTERAVRAPTSSAYKSGESSAARKEVHEDPYREPPA